MLARLKNARLAGHDTCQFPFTKNDFEVAKVLAREGFVRDVQKKSFGKRQVIEAKLFPLTDTSSGFSDFKIISKPSRRLYYGYRQLYPVRQNFGIAVISTPSGIMTNSQARKQKVGGEYLFQIW